RKRAPGNCDRGQEIALRTQWAGPPRARLKGTAPYPAVAPLVMNPVILPARTATPRRHPRPTTTLDPTKEVAMTITASSRAVSPGPAAYRPGIRQTLSLGLLVSAQFVVMLDTSIVNVALPSIQADLALGPAGLAWVVNAYVLAFGGLLVLS